MRRLVLTFYVLLAASQLTVADQKQPQEPFVFGYADKLSCVPGEEVAFHISSSADSVRIVIERQGGTNETVFDKPGIPCATQPIPDRASSHGCDWPATFKLTVPGDWKSGCYIATLIVTTKDKESRGQVLFVVRAAEPGKNTRILLQLATNTYNAYTNWGGHSLYLLGATPNAVEFAVWDLLHEFGYRFYFPSKTWEVVPKRSHLSIDVDRLEKPDFYNRSAPRGGIRRALRPWAIAEWEQWQVRNRTRSSFVLSTGHAYDGVLSRNRTEFKQHPEYLALRNGERGGNKFCISNPGLRELVVRDAVAQIEADPSRDSVSLDPSDGGGWCECDACRKMGSVSDRVIILCNAAADAMNSLGHGEKFVGTYAYNYHSPPPQVVVHPDVVVSLATAFIKGDQTFDEMLTGWAKQSRSIGIRDYYGLPVWHQSMPGTGKAGRPLILAQTIRDQHTAGARFLNAESDDAWGPNGLGYYLASRVVWDVGISAQSVIDDFLSNCFGPAKEPMREFYNFIGSGPRHSDHLVGTMYRLLQKARGLTTDPQIVARIHSLVLYTRYVELYRKSEGQKGFDRVVKFLWRSRRSIMCDSIGMFSYLNRDARKKAARTWIPGDPQSMNLPPERLRERGDEPFSESEILAFIENGIRNHDVLDFTPLDFSDDLIGTVD